MGTLLLDSINQPRDLKQLNEQQVKQLCAEIRQFLLENISKTGGHLASNLGVVELTVALHRVLDTPQDKIVFDVGHQCYTHKILTGRRGQFDKLRQLDGISGFPDPNESEHDAFIAGHGNTALSLAIGMAWAKKLHHEAGLVVAVIGDGAFTGGMVYEGMNNIEQLDNLLVILNDNKMSISKNVGALARYLTHLRTTTAYFDAKDNVRSFLDGVPLVGAPLKKNITECKTLLRRAMYHSTMFEDMGFQYIGPVDGHNVEELERTLRTIRNRQGPHFLHVITKKGKGYQPAEVNPGNYHGVSAFDPDGMPDPEVAPKESFSTVFGNALVTEGDRNPNICAITAAMKYGTGLQFFAHSHPERFFDVGMAEQHAVRSHIQGVLLVEPARGGLFHKFRLVESVAGDIEFQSEFRLFRRLRFRLVQQLRFFPAQFLAFDVVMRKIEVHKINERGDAFVEIDFMELEQFRHAGGEEPLKHREILLAQCAEHVADLTDVMRVVLVFQVIFRDRPGDPFLLRTVEHLFRFRERDGEHLLRLAAVGRQDASAFRSLRQRRRPSARENLIVYFLECHVTPPGFWFRRCSWKN